MSVPCATQFIRQLLRLTAVVLCLLVSPASGQEPTAEPKPVPVAQPELPTHYFRLAPSIWVADDESESLFPLLGAKDDPLGRIRDAQPFLKRYGVKFPPGSSAIFDERASILTVQNTDANLQRVAETLQTQKVEIAWLVRTEVRLVEFQPEDEAQLAGKLTFAALQAKLGDRLQTLTTGSLSSPSGQRATGEIEATAKTPAKPKKARAADDERPWPPPPNIELATLEIEPTLFMHSSIDLNFYFRYARPAQGDVPAIVTNLQTNLSLRPGTIYKARTFTVWDAKRNGPRYYAILVRGALVDELGRTAEEIRAVLRQPPAPAK